jgi:hypothetical protein
MNLKLGLYPRSMVPGGVVLVCVLLLASCNNTDQSPAGAARTAAVARATTPTATRPTAAGIPPTLAVTSNSAASSSATPELARTSGNTEPLPEGVPGLTASPNPVPADGQMHGTTTVAWTLGQSEFGEVYVSTDGGPERLFASGSNGAQDAPWITSGSSYDFRLYRGTAHQERLATLAVTRGSSPAVGAEQPEVRSLPVLTAEPNPVLWTGPELATTIISWAGGGPEGAEVYVSADGEAEQLFARGTQGSQTAGWICRGSTYVFHLYAGVDRKGELAAITVTRGQTDASQPAPEAARCRRGNAG